MKKENADLSLQADGATDALEGLRNEIQDLVEQQVEEKEQQMEKVHQDFNKCKVKLAIRTSLSKAKSQKLKL